MKVKHLIAELQKCDLESDVWAVQSTDLDDSDLRGLLIDKVIFDDDDSEESREIGRKKYGTNYLRIPVLVIEEN